MSQVTENQVVSEEQVPTTTKKSTNRNILGVKLSEKLPNELIASIEVIQQSKGKVNVSFLELYNLFLIELSKISKSKSNTKTRFRRILYRNLEGILLKNSIQSAKFNLKANVSGIVIKAKNEILFKDNGDAITDTVDNNFFTFKVLKKVDTIKELEITNELLAKVLELKNK